MADRPPGLHAEARRVAERLNGLLHRTITQRRLVITLAGPSPDGAPRVYLTFRQGGPVLAPLRSRFGQIGLYVGQILETPTGTVTLEDVIRFCIHDLGVPALSEDWNEILVQSYRESEDQIRGDL